MLLAWIFTAVYSLALPLASAKATQGRSFLASAWRAGRAGLAERWQLERQGSGEGPAPAPAPAPVTLPPRPSPYPPKFPVIGPDECELFQLAFLVSPDAKCSWVKFAENVDGCTCQIVLPASINPQPANFYNPFLVDIPPNPDIPIPPAMPTVPPPSNPMQPYVAPMMPPACPFINACADPDGFDCVGFNSWGFGYASMAPFTPAAAALNSVSCSYTMKPYAQFQVPAKVAALWHLNDKLVKVFARMSGPFAMKCSKSVISAASLQDFCKERIHKLKFGCDVTWAELAKKTAKSCATAPAPDGFESDSTLAELCPMECGWKKGMTRWPPFLTAAEVKKMKEEAKKKKEEEEKKKLAEEEAKKEKKEEAKKEKKEKKEAEEKKKEEEKEAEAAEKLAKDAAK